MAACVMMTACSSESEDEMVNGQSSMVNDKAEVVLTFSPYEMTAMTRAATSVSEAVTRLDVWLYESGAEVTAVHQSSSDDGFGSISVTLDKTKTYTLYAVGHRSGGAATLEDGVITFPDDKVTHSMYYSTTFSPSTTTELSCEMTRIVAQFRFEITDDIPAACKKLQFTISDVFDRWNVSTGGTHQLNRTSTVNYGGTSPIFNVYAIVTDAETLHTVTVTALDASDQAISSQSSRTFTDVPLRNGYKTTYRGTFFIDTPVTSGFTVDDWNEYDAVDF